MTFGLAVLIVATVALVAVPTSALVRGALPWLDRLAGLLAPRAAVRFWLVLAALPAVFAGLLVTTAFLPAFGIGTDHCLQHGEPHPHLCLAHGADLPGVALLAMSLLVAACILRATASLVRSVRLIRETSWALHLSAEPQGDVLVFDAREPQAFVLGVFRTRVHVSRALLALGPDIVEPVLAHERAHIRWRDPLWRVCVPVLAVGHLPATARALAARIGMAQELAADAEAATSLTDGRTRVAEALLALVERHHAPLHSVAFVHGNVDARVRALLREPVETRTSITASMLGAVVALFGVVVTCHEAVHHTLERLLGMLS
ncbi:MAG: M48 family metalloprotease [Polyangiales bacterium]|nr:M48 family metalloprotease [Myxococcales bacterium]